MGSLFIFIVVTRKFGRSTFELSLIFKFEMLAILKFDCSKFQPSPKIRFFEKLIFQYFTIENSSNSKVSFGCSKF